MKILTILTLLTKEKKKVAKKKRKDYYCYGYLLIRVNWMDNVPFSV